MGVTKGQHLIGKVLGSCVLEKLLGYGGSSVVFLARQTAPERKVAIKVFLPRTNMDRRMQRDFYRRFLREAEAASKLNHPNILPIYSYGEEEGLPYIVMPYMPGGTLAEYMAKRAPLSLQEAQWYLEQLAAALDYAHEHGCVHCDVKPANILLDSAGHVILSDFGIARLTRTDGEAEQTQIKGPEAVMGTPDYISPEQALGQELDGRSDVYSLGVTLFFLLTKRLPFRADSAIALALMHVHEVPPSLALIRADVNPVLDHVVQTALAKDPNRRFQSAGAFCTAFTQMIATSEKKSVRSKSPASLAQVAATSLSDLPPVRIVTRPVSHWQFGWRQKKSVLRLVVMTLMLLAVVGAVVFSVLLMAVQPVPPARAVVTPTATPTAKPAAADLLANPGNWPTSSTFFFDAQNQHYHILNKFSNSVAIAQDYYQNFGDFRLTVTATEVRTTSTDLDYYGVIFRAASDQSQYYLFEITPAQNAQYAFLRYDSNGNWAHISTGFASSLLTRPGASNTITVEARGNSFTFLINGQQVGSAIADPAKNPLLTGQIGLYVEDQGTEVEFSHFYVESLK